MPPKGAGEIVWWFMGNTGRLAPIGYPVLTVSILFDVLAG